MGAIAFALWKRLALGEPLPLSVAGSGVLFIATSLILFLAGLLGEMIYRLGDLREDRLAQLTSTLSMSNPSPRTPR